MEEGRKVRKRKKERMEEGRNEERKKEGMKEGKKEKKRKNGRRKEVKKGKTDPQLFLSKALYPTLQHIAVFSSKTNETYHKSGHHLLCLPYHTLGIIYCVCYTTRWGIIYCV